MEEDPLEIVRRGYDRVSREYGAEDRSHYKTWLTALESHLSANARVLDLGCGCGLPVAGQLSRAHAVTGIDISEAQVARARELVPDATFRREDMTRVSFPEASWDAVVALYSLIHVPLQHQRSLLTRMAGWLRPEGLLLISVGAEAWTGTEDSWLGVEGATMYWSHADTATYREWLRERGLTLLQEWFQPEGDSGHPIFLARKTDRKISE